MWRVIDGSYQNAKFIFPTKQKAVGEMIKECKKDKNFKKIIIFGSAITASCNPWSDVDIFFELEAPVNVYPTINSKQAFDKWDNFTVSKELMSEIKKGVVVYER